MKKDKNSLEEIVKDIYSYCTIYGFGVASVNIMFNYVIRIEFEKNNETGELCLSIAIPKYEEPRLYVLTTLIEALDKLHRDRQKEIDKLKKDLNIPNIITNCNILGEINFYGDVV